MEVEVGVEMFQSIESRATMKPSYTILGTCSKDSTSHHRNDCMSKLITTLFTVSKKWNRPRCPSIDEWTQKMWYLHTMAFYSDL